MQWADGSKFEGQWNMDKRVYGIMTMPDDTVYVGGFMDEVFHGKGKITFKKENNVFVGLFQKGKAYKFGKMIYPNGEMYVGQMIDYLKDGIGILYLSNGNRYEGTFT